MQRARNGGGDDAVGIVAILNQRTKLAMSDLDFVDNVEEDESSAVATTLFAVVLSLRRLDAFHLNEPSTMPRPVSPSLCVAR